VSFSFGTGFLRSKEKGVKDYISCIPVSRLQISSVPNKAIKHQFLLLIQQHTTKLCSVLTLCMQSYMLMHLQRHHAVSKHCHPNTYI